MLEVIIKRPGTDQILIKGVFDVRMGWEWATDKGTPIVVDEMAVYAFALSCEAISRQNDEQYRSNIDTTQD